ELKKYFDAPQIVEITMVSCFFNFWNRFTDGLQADIEDSPEMNSFAAAFAAISSPIERSVGAGPGSRAPRLRRRPPATTSVARRGS
ncbi:MAG: hypothetical protein O3B74_12725, partial [Proteobacteria bacterium]|nr:hypothetical protein [Pseudomonadota bacterium]